MDTKLDLNLIKVFLAIYRCGSVSQAAQALHLSQSAVSHALNRLRLQVDDALFIRQGTSLSPTIYAQTIAPMMQQSLEDLYQTLYGQKQFDPSKQATKVVIAMRDDFENLLIPKLIAQQSEQCLENIHWHSVRLDRKTLAEDLASGRIDIALDVAQPNPSVLRTHQLFEDKMCVVTGNRIKKMNRDTYESALHIAVSGRAQGASLEDWLLQKFNVKRQIVLRCQRYLTALNLISQKTPFCLTIPRTLLDTLLNNNNSLRKEIQVFDLPYGDLPMYLYMVWDVHQEKHLKNQWIRQQLLSLYQ